MVRKVTASTTARQARLLDLLADLAEAGRPCPTNDALVEALGFDSTRSLRKALLDLSRRGLITIHQVDSCHRTIAVGGHETAPGRGHPSAHVPAALTDDERTAVDRLRDARTIVFTATVYDRAARGWFYLNGRLIDRDELFRRAGMAETGRQRQGGHA